MKHNVLMIWNRVGDYHLARWRNLEARGFFKEVYTAQLGVSDRLYKWTSGNDPILHLSQKPVEAFDLINRIKNFVSILKNKKINVVVLAGYGKLEYILFIIISQSLGKKVILFAESWYGTNTLKNLIKGLFLKKTVNGLFVSGIRAMTHFKNSLGLKKMRMMMGYSTVDNDHFSVQNDFRSNIILCVARYSAEKNLFMLIKAFRRSKLFHSHILMLLGDGPLKDQLREEIGEYSDKIILCDWKAYHELPACYASSKCLVLPSLFEPWGLVVNEAMAAGLPVIASNQCGCVEDLLQEGFGLTFDAHSEQDLISCLNELSRWQDKEFLHQSSLGKSTIKKFSLDSWSESLIKLV